MVNRQHEAMMEREEYLARENAQLLIIQARAEVEKREARAPKTIGSLNVLDGPRLCGICYRRHVGECPEVSL